MSAKRMKLPLLPLRTVVFFPGSVGTVQVKRDRSLRLMQGMSEGTGKLVLLPVFDTGTDLPEEKDFNQIGVIARPIVIRHDEDNTLNVTFEASERVRLNKIEQQDPHWTGSFIEIGPEEADETLEAMIGKVAALARGVLESDPTYSSEEIQIFASRQRDPVRLVDFLSYHLKLGLAAKRELLNELEVGKRLAHLHGLLLEICQRLDLEREMKARVEQSIDRAQREVFLRAQLKEIRKELGEEGEDDNLAASYRGRAQMLTDLPLEVKEQIFLETERLRVISTASSEYGMIKSYLDWLLAIPWNRKRGKECNLSEVEKIIDADFYGSLSVKDRIIEYLAIRQLSNADSSPALCLCGPAGTGKAALSHAIAESLNRRMIRFSVAGFVDAVEVRGEPRTLMGAMPGKIVTSLIEADCVDPVILIEDLDKLSQDETRIYAALAFLGVIDARENWKFMDDYVSVPIDLSSAIFIFSVRSTEDIPDALVERMEVVEFAGYIDREKIHIAEKYLIPSILSRHGLETGELTFSQGALKKMIQNYTMEAGLGQLKGRIELICRRYSKAKATGERKVTWSITEDNLEKHLGTAIYIPEKGMSQPEIGVATGVAWTGAGGDIMMIEGLKMRGAGMVTSTGSLGEIMRESVQAAHSFVRSKAGLLSVPHEDFSDFDIHIHFPQGAIPKDGPSAGVTICLVIASVMSNRPIRNDIAMTGEVSLRGRVLPVAGVKEKIAAAHRAGIYKFVLPTQNRKDLKDITRQLRDEMEFIFIDRIEDLFDTALMDYEPGAETLEDLLRLEMQEMDMAEQPDNTKAAKGRNSSKPRKPSKSKRKPPARRKKK